MVACKFTTRRCLYDLLSFLKIFSETPEIREIIQNVSRITPISLKTSHCFHV